MMKLMVGGYYICIPYMAVADKSTQVPLELRVEQYSCPVCYAP